MRGQPWLHNEYINHHGFLPVSLTAIWQLREPHTVGVSPGPPLPQPVWASDNIAQQSCRGKLVHFYVGTGFRIWVGGPRSLACHRANRPLDPGKGSWVHKEHLLHTEMLRNIPTEVQLVGQCPTSPVTPVRFLHVELFGLICRNSCASLGLSDPPCCSFKATPFPSSSEVHTDGEAKSEGQEYVYKGQKFLLRSKGRTGFHSAAVDYFLDTPSWNQPCSGGASFLKLLETRAFLFPPRLIRTGKRGVPFFGFLSSTATLAFLTATPPDF